MTTYGYTKNNTGLAGTALLTGEVIPDTGVSVPQTVGTTTPNTPNSAVTTPSVNISRYQEWLATQNGSTPEATKPSNSLMGNLGTLGTLGLGLAGFLEDRKTANLQRQALRQDIATAREHRANRQALGNSWNNAWSK